MIIQQLKISAIASINHFFYQFTNDVNIIKIHTPNDLCHILRFILNHNEFPPIPSLAIKAESEIKAKIFVAGELYEVIALPDSSNSKLILKAYRDGAVVTDEYLYLTKHCAEQDLSEIFDGRYESAQLRPLEYFVYDDSEKKQKLARLSDGFSKLPAFNSYLRNFTKSFIPQTICNGKNFILELNENGMYDIKQINNDGLPISLNKTEHLLFRYLCFLHTVEFWRGFEEIRNIDAIKKPLIIKNLVENLEKSAEINDIIKKSSALDRQIILLSII